MTAPIREKIDKGDGDRLLPSPLRYVLIATTLLPIVLLPAFGQRVLTLDDCVRIALQQNLSLRSADNAVRSAQFARTENGRTVLPQVRVEGKASDAPNSGRFGYDPAITDGGQLSAQLVVQESLFDGGARGIRSDQLSTDVDRLRTEQHRTERDVRFGVTNAFIDLLQTQSEAALQQQRVDELSNYLDLVNRLFHGGGASYTDVLKTQVSLENAKVTLQKALQSVVSAKVSLAEAMGLPLDTAFSIAGTLEPPETATIDSVVAQTFVDSASNLDLRIADFNLQRSLFDVDLARTERFPVISLSGDAGYLSSGDNLRLPPDQRVSGWGYSVGVTVENLVFGWGITDLRIQQVQLSAETMRFTYEQQRRGIVADAARLRSQITSSIDQLRSINHTLTIANDNYTLTKAQYAGGGATALDVLSAEQLLSENRSTELQTRADLHRLLARARQLSEH